MPVGQIVVSATASSWPPSAPISSDEKNMPPRKPEPSEMIDATILSTKKQRHGPKRQASIPAKCSAPWPDDITCGATIANSPTRSPPIAVRSSRPQVDANKQDFAQRHAAHDENSGRRASRPISAAMSEIVRGDRHLIGRDDADLGRRQRVRHEVAEQRRDGDRRQAVRRIAADDQLEAVKRAGERRAERAGNSASGATADQDAQVGAPQPKRHADARGDAAGQLRISGLDADRRADAARPHRLRSDDDAAEKRHAAAVQRVRFDRIDLPFRPPAHDQFARDAEDDPAGKRHRDRHQRIEPQQSRQPHAGLKMKKHAMQNIDAGAHRRHDHVRRQRRPAPQARSGSIPAPARRRASAAVSPIDW